MVNELMGNKPEHTQRLPEQLVHDVEPKPKKLPPEGFHPWQHSQHPEDPALRIARVIKKLWGIRSITHWLLNLPKGQAMHSVPPFEYSPAGQVPQLEAPRLEPWPAGQGWQWLVVPTQIGRSDLAGDKRGKRLTW